MEMNRLYQQRLHRFATEVTLYPVSCERLARGRSDDEWLEAVLAGGARIVQLRDKEADDRTLYDKALRFRVRTRQAGALFIVNNRVDIALLTEADGVHLGDTDLPPEAARRLGPNLLIGISCHSPEQVRTARQRGASYYNIGPLFETGTKEGLSHFLGSRAVPEFSVCSDLPFTVMGGIKLHHIPELTGLGARRIAVVTALIQERDIAAETRKWILAIDKGRNHVE